MPATLRHGSCCTGYGGLDLAARQVLGGELAWVADSDRDATTVLAARFPGVRNLGDITAVDWTRVPPVDVLTAGYPCQPLSFAGRRAGMADERWIWDDVYAAIRDLRPRIVVLENVTGHLSLGFGRVLGDLAAAGFDAEWGCYRAADVGAPHRRERVFVLAWPAADAPRVGHGHAGTPGGRGLPAAAVAGAAGDGDRLTLLPTPRTSDAHGTGAHVDGGADLRTTVADLGDPDQDRWGIYAAAVARWEVITGRPAPEPTQPGTHGKPVLAPPFVEWLMGLPAGWVTDLLPRNPALRVLGNGVVPAQAAAAIGDLLRSAVA